MRLAFILATSFPLLCGCVMVEVGVTNPVAGLTTVAVAPFFNLSQERSVDGRRFALAYYTELQKTPGFQVIPLGVVEQTMFDQNLEMNNPADVLRLSQLLGADAVVVGAVTDYSPYYPPRIGMQVSWYSPKPWQFYPGVPIEDFGRELFKPPHKMSLIKSKHIRHKSCPPDELTGMGSIVTSRGQSPEATAASPTRTISLSDFLKFGEEGPPRELPTTDPFTEQAAPRELNISDVPNPLVIEEMPPPIPPPPATTSVQPDKFQIQPMDAFDPTLPLMSYTRIFDGADAKLTSRLRDYVELSGDLRAGGWESYLQRSEDFIRFTAHVMIVEMLQLHGGEARKRVVFKLRKYR